MTDGGPRSLVELAAVAVVRLRWLVVPAWAAGAVLATIALPAPGEARGDALGSLVPRNAPAVLAQRRSAELFRFPVLSSTAVVQRDEDGLSPAEQARVVERAAQIGRQAYPELLSVPFALPVLNTLGAFPGAPERDTTAVSFLFFEPGVGLGDRVKLANWFIDVRMDEDRETVAGVTGIVPARVEQGRLIEEAVPLVEAATVALIALVVGLGFRSVVAPLVTLVAVAVAYLVALRLASFVGAVPSEVEPILLVLLLGLVTDYCIFYLAGLRQRLRGGEERRAAVWRAAAEVSPIVATAGVIVAAGAASLVVARLEFFRVFGPALGLAVLVGLAVSLTFVPAALALLGRAAFWPSRPPAAPEREPRRSRLFATRPRAALLAAVGIAALVAASTGAAGMELGLTPLRSLPDDREPARAARAAEEGFGAGILSPTLVLVESPILGRSRGGVNRLQRLIEDLPGVRGVVGPANLPGGSPLGIVLAPGGTAARYILVLDDAPLSPAAIDTVERLRDAMPGLLDRVGLPAAAVSIGGNTAIAEETIELLLDDLLRIALAVLAVNAVLLALFLRSLLAPLYLVAASTLAVAAALGLTTYALDEEFTYYVPFMAGVLLVSLGSDYNVFLVGRIWQERRRRPLEEAIAVAVPRASKAIGVAALALALSFALLALVPLSSFRELAVVMAVGVVLDAFLVRALVAPGLVRLLSRSR